MSNMQSGYAQTGACAGALRRPAAPRQLVEVTRRTTSKVLLAAGGFFGAMAQALAGLEPRTGLPRVTFLSLELSRALKYGENPHQKGALYRIVKASFSSPTRTSWCNAEELSAAGESIGYNNLADVSTAAAAVAKFRTPAAAIVKHTSLCGLATSSSLERAYVLARDTDPTSAFGCAAAFNRCVDPATASVVLESFVQLVTAPGFDESALHMLRRKKGLRILRAPPSERPTRVLRSLDHDVLAQELDAGEHPDLRGAAAMTRRTPDPAQRRALEFAWWACRPGQSHQIASRSDCVVMPSTRRRYPLCQPASRRLFATPSFFPLSPP